MTVVSKTMLMLTVIVMKITKNAGELARKYVERGDSCTTTVTR